MSVHLCVSHIFSLACFFLFVLYVFVCLSLSYIILLLFFRCLFVFYGEGERLWIPKVGGFSMELGKGG